MKHLRTTWNGTPQNSMKWNTSEEHEMKHLRRAWNETPQNRMKWNTSEEHERKHLRWAWKETPQNSMKGNTAEQHETFVWVPPYRSGHKISIQEHCNFCCNALEQSLAHISLELSMFQLLLAKPTRLWWSIGVKITIILWHQWPLERRRPCRDSTVACLSRA